MAKAGGVRRPALMAKLTAHGMAEGKARRIANKPTTKAQGQQKAKGGGK